MASDGYISKYSVPSRSNLHFKFLTYGHSGAQPWAPECPNVRNLKCRLDLMDGQVYNQLTSLPFKGLKQYSTLSYHSIRETDRQREQIDSTDQRRRANDQTEWHTTAAVLAHWRTSGGPGTLCCGHGSARRRHYLSGSVWPARQLFTTNWQQQLALSVYTNARIQAWLAHAKHWWPWVTLAGRPQLAYCQSEPMQFTGCDYFNAWAYTYTYSFAIFAIF